LGIVERRVLVAADPHLASQHVMQSAVLAISRGNLARATDHLASGSHARASNATRGQHHALHALVLSALDRSDEAEDQVRSALLQSNTVETHALVAASSLVRSALGSDPAGCIRAYEEILESGAVYVLALAWRARYEAAVMLLNS